jgi:hypothetical protein
MQVTNEIIILSYTEGVVSYTIQLQKGITNNPNVALWESLDEEHYLFAHATSWRFIETEGLILSWFVFSKEQQVQETIYTKSPIVGSESATNPGSIPIQIQTIVAHGLRHLALLNVQDPVFHAAIPLEFSDYLSTLDPATARHILVVKK